MDVADRLRWSRRPFARASSRSSAAARRGPLPWRRAPRHALPPSPVDVVLPRPGQEALRLRVNQPEDVRGRLVGAYFVNEVQRVVFEGLESGRPASDVIDEMTRHGDDLAAQVLSQLVVDDLDREYSAVDVTAVIAQLLRTAVSQELRAVDRELREGAIAPDVAMATIRDVKARVELLESAHADMAESDLRDWLLARSAATHP